MKSGPENWQQYKLNIISQYLLLIICCEGWCVVPPWVRQDHSCHPAFFFQEAIDTLHGAKFGGHLCKLSYTARSVVTMRNDVVKWCKACIVCATWRQGWAVTPLLIPIPVAGPFDCVGIDIQFTKSSKDSKNAIVFVDWRSGLRPSQQGTIRHWQLRIYSSQRFSLVTEFHRSCFLTVVPHSCPHWCLKSIDCWESQTQTPVHTTCRRLSGAIPQYPYWHVGQNWAEMKDCFNWSNADSCHPTRKLHPSSTRNWESRLS